MLTRFAIAALIWPMIQAVLFGLGVVGLLVSPLETPEVMTALWWMIAATLVISTPLAWLIAPRLRLRTR